MLRYTALIAAVLMTTSPALAQQDPAADYPNRPVKIIVSALEPVAVMSKFPNVLLVRQDFPAKTVQEFIAYAKADPGKVTYASQGPGTTSHLTAELFSKATGT